MKTARYIAACVVLLTCGCIKLDHTLTLAKDGSGSVDINIIIPSRSTFQLSEMLNLKRELDKANNASSRSTARELICRAIIEGSQDDIANSLKPYEKHGIKLERKRLEVNSGIRSIYLKLSFADLKKVSESDIFQMYGFSVNRNKDGNYIITRPSDASGRKGHKTATRPRNELNTHTILEGFEVIIRVRTPGIILKTNAQRKSTYSAVWNYDITLDKDAPDKLQHQNFGIVFDGRDVNIPEIKYSPAP